MCVSFLCFQKYFQFFFSPLTNLVFAVTKRRQAMNSRRWESLHYSFILFSSKMFVRLSMFSFDLLQFNCATFRHHRNDSPTIWRAQSVLGCCLFVARFLYVPTRFCLMMEIKIKNHFRVTLEARKSHTAHLQCSLSFPFKTARLFFFLSFLFFLPVDALDRMQACDKRIISVIFVFRRNKLSLCLCVCVCAVHEATIINKTKRRRRKIKQKTRLPDVDCWH